MLTIDSGLWCQSLLIILIENCKKYMLTTLSPKVSAEVLHAFTCNKVKAGKKILDKSIPNLKSLTLVPSCCSKQRWSWTIKVFFFPNLRNPNNTNQVYGRGGLTSCQPTSLNFHWCSLYIFAKTKTKFNLSISTPVNYKKIVFLIIVSMFTKNMIGGQVAYIIYFQYLYN